MKQITVISDDVEKLIFDAQRELLNLSEWIWIYNLIRCPSRTEYITICRTRRIEQLVISGRLLLNGTEIKRAHKIQVSQSRHR